MVGTTFTGSIRPVQVMSDGRASSNPLYILSGLIIGGKLKNKNKT